MKLPIHYSKNEKINKKTTLGWLLKAFNELGIQKVDALNKIDVNLRNGLSHCLFWFDQKGDSEHPESHLHYATNITFQNIEWISIKDLFLKERQQSICTNCLVNVIADWFR